MLFSVEQAFVGREEIRAPLKTPAWEATSTPVIGGNPRPLLSGERRYLESWVLVSVQFSYP